MDLFAGTSGFSYPQSDAWADRIRAHADRWRAVYVFFEQEGALMARRLASRFTAPAAQPTTEAIPAWP